MNSRIAKTTFIIALGVICGAVAAQSPLNYVFTTSFSPNFAPADILVTDVTGSPAPDILFLNASANFLRILENIGMSQVPPATDVTVGATPQRIVAGDFDGDGDVDLATANAANVSVLIRSGASYARTDYALAGTGQLVVADVNGDGVKDLVRGVGARMGVSPGVFSATTTTLVTPLGTPFDVLVGDFDGDGDLDLLVLRAFGGNVQLDLHLNAGGAFSAPVSTTIPDGKPWIGGSDDTTSADLNGDGRADLLLFSSGAQPAQLLMLAGQTNGAFAITYATSLCTFSAFGTFQAPVLRDLDGDGNPDAVLRFSYAPVPALLWNVVLLTLRNVGNGAFFDLRNLYEQTASTSTNTALDRAVDAGDLDQDGDRDIVAQKAAPPANNLDVFLADTSTIPTSSNFAITAVQGSGQTLAAEGGPSDPLVVRVSDSSGAPVPNAYVRWEFSGPTPLQNPACLNALAQTNAQGESSITLSPGAGAGPFTVTAAINYGNNPATFSGTVVQAQISSFGPTSQSIVMLGYPPQSVAPPQPLVVRALDNLGTPIANMNVFFTTTTAASTLPFVNGVRIKTDAQGLATLTLTPSGTLPATTVYGATGPNPALLAANQVTAFSVAVFGPVLSIVGGTPQATDVDDVFHTPLAVHVADPAGAPLSGVPVHFDSTTPTMITTATPTVLTDGNGDAAATAASLPQAASAATPNFIARATIDASAFAVSFNLFVRRLTVTGSAAQGAVTFDYAHEAGPTPLIFTVDLPQPAPTQTPYGALATSILAPGPGLFVADALGTFGALDPSLVANPGWLRTYAVPPSVAGFAFTAQILGFDATYYPDLLQAIFVSNAVTKTL